jgi:uncharacterized protein (TIGR03437 family)
VAPALFAANSDGKGVAAAIARLIHADGTQSAAPVFTCSGPGSCTAVPVELGAEADVAVLELYGTGARGRSSLDSVSCTIGGIAAQVSYAGTQSQYPGVDQVIVVIPRDVARTVPVAIRLTVDGRDANEVTITAH